MKTYVDKNALQDYTTKLIAKEKTIFATKNQVGSPLVAPAVSAMTDHTRIYVYVGSETGYIAGNWYYWNGSAWTSGGIYNSEGFVLDDTLTNADEPAQAKIVGDALRGIENGQFIQLDGTKSDEAFIGSTAGQIDLSGSIGSYTKWWAVKIGQEYSFYSTGNRLIAAEYDQIVDGEIGTFVAKDNDHPSEIHSFIATKPFFACYYDYRGLGAAADCFLYAHSKTNVNLYQNTLGADPEERELYRQDVLVCAASYLVNEANSSCIVGTPQGITDKPFVALYNQLKGYENMYNDSANQFVYTDTAEYNGVSYPVVYLDCTAFVGLMTKCIPYAESPMYYAFSNIDNIDKKIMFEKGFENGTYITKPYTFDLHQYNSTYTNLTAFFANHSGNRLFTLYKNSLIDETVYQWLETGDILYIGYQNAPDKYRKIGHIQIFLKTLDELNTVGQELYGVSFQSSSIFPPDGTGLHGYVIEAGREDSDEGQDTEVGLDCIRVVSLDSWIAKRDPEAIYAHKANATAFNSIKASLYTFKVLDHALYL